MSGGNGGLLSGIMRSLSGGEASPVKSPGPHLKSVPSFNDFSSGVATDSELEYQSPKATPDKRAGMLHLPFFSHSPTYPQDEATGVQRAVSTPTNAVAEHAMPIPVKRTQSLRMQGMDAFEYCDLIRSL